MKFKRYKGTFNDGWLVIIGKYDGNAMLKLRYFRNKLIRFTVFLRTEKLINLFGFNEKCLEYWFE